MAVHGLASLFGVSRLQSPDDVAVLLGACGRAHQRRPGSAVASTPTLATVPTLDGVPRVLNKEGPIDRFVTHAHLRFVRVIQP